MKWQIHLIAPNTSNICILTIRKKVKWKYYLFQEVHKIHPDIDTMRKIVAHKNNLIFPYPNLLTAYELKLITEEKELTLIEATMYPLQLYNSGNPLWTRPFSPAIIQLILEHKNSPNFDKIFQSQLAKCRKD